MIKLVKNIWEAKFVTHAGNFHADDVFSTVFMEHLFKDITLIRLKEYEDDKKLIAYDIGLGKFDHHGPLYDKKRPNGIHYCSFGLLWQEYGLEYLRKNKIKNEEEVFKIFDELLVEQIDAFDNGEYHISASINIYTLSSIIDEFRPKDSNEDEDTCFLKAVSFASTIFDAILKDAVIKNDVIEKIKTMPIQDKVLILDEYIPYEYAIFKLGLDIEFVVYPSNRGGYAAKTISTQYKGFTPKVPFKKSWAGLRDEKLQEISGVKTAKFCHNNCFIVTAKTQEDALKLIAETRKDNNTF